MGLLISRAWTTLLHQLSSSSLSQRKLCIIGLDNAGKTTLLYQLSLGEVVETQPTIGSNVEEFVWNSGNSSVAGNNSAGNLSAGKSGGKVKFQVWDLGGQDSLRTSWVTYFQDTDAVIVVVDSTDKARMPILKNELSTVLKYEGLARAVILVFANKQDLSGACSAAEISQFLQLHSIKSHPWHIQASCALTGQGLAEGLDWIVHQLKSSQ